MRNKKFINFAVFLIFFGIALIEAIRNRNWPEAGLFLALGLIFIWADIRKD